MPFMDLNLKVLNSNKEERVKAKIRKVKKSYFQVIKHSKTNYEKVSPFSYVFDSLDEALEYAENQKVDSCAEIIETKGMFGKI